MSNKILWLTYERIHTSQEQQLILFKYDIQLHYKLQISSN